MKYSQSGFAYIVVIIILAVSITVGGMYYTKSKQKNIESDAITYNSSPSEIQVTKKEISPIVTTNTSVTVTNTVPNVDVKRDPVIRWLYQRLPAGDEFTTKVTLEIDGKKYDAGTYSGGCYELDKNQLIGNQISAVVCAYGGVNDELSVVKMADGKLLLMHTRVNGDMLGTKAKITSRFDSKILLRID